jgi:hypothetical protein
MSASIGNGNGNGNSTSTVSENKRAASRKNAQKSTGPKTPQGKAASAQNARAHGVFCKDLLLPGESESALDNLRELHLLRFLPHDVVELHLVERILAIAWRLRRVQAADAHLHNAHALVMKDNHVRKYGDLQNPDPDESPDENYQEHDADHGNDDDDDPTEFTPTPGLVIASIFNQSAQADRPRATPYERLLTVEQRLTGMMHRAIKELRTLQAERKKKEDRDGPSLLPECPFLKTKDDLIAELKAAGELPEDDDDEDEDDPHDDENDHEDDEDDHEDDEHHQPTARQSAPNHAAAPQISNLQNEPTAPRDAQGGVASAAPSPQNQTTITPREHSQ